MMSRKKMKNQKCIFHVRKSSKVFHNFIQPAKKIQYPDLNYYFSICRSFVFKEQTNVFSILGLIHCGLEEHTYLGELGQHWVK